MLITYYICYQVNLSFTILNSNFFDILTYGSFDQKKGCLFEAALNIDSILD